ncbi:MAG: DUF192 domain-containing protein [Cyanobacteria bacterium K_DeepCast_35m_m2_155]|nr:DUF192 domain-containing protein [Cyanobacteria bacterium K_DeepCast_35m_m2_155]
MAFPRSPDVTAERKPLLRLSLTAALLATSGVSLAPAVASPNRAQQLPLEAQWCLQPQTCILLEVADEPHEQAKGLQHRAPLPPLRGMWFPFRSDILMRFWMHQTPSPLDMLFIDDGRVIAIEANATPCARLPCRSYGPDQPGDAVIELAAGEAARLGISVGTAVQIKPLPASAR